MDTKKLFFNIVTILLILGFSFGFVGELSPVNAVGGAYTIKFSAAQSDDYVPGIPYASLVNYPNPPGRDNGNLLIPRAYYTVPGGTKASIESINPYGMALCQVVPFEFEITVNGNTAPENGVIKIVAGWSAQTTSGGNFGYDETVVRDGKYGVIAAFIDTGDGSFIDPGNNAQVFGYTTAIINNEIQGTFTVQGLDNGDKVVMEVWLVLDCTINSKVTGNVASRLISAQTVPPAGGTPDAISTGNQTVPLLQVSSFLSTGVYLSVYKVDDNNPALEPGRIWKNTIVVTAGPDNQTGDYVANGVAIVDTLDNWVQIVDTEPFDAANHPYGYKITQKSIRTCTYAPLITTPPIRGGTFTCNLWGISEDPTPSDEGVIFNIVTIEYWLTAVPGVATGSLCEGAPGVAYPNPSGEIAPATLATSDCPAGYDVRNRVDLTALSNDRTPGDNWDEEPKDIAQPNAVEIEYFQATGKSKSVLLEWKTVTEINNLGFNIYRALTISGPRVKINAQLIPADIFGQEGAKYEYLDRGLFPNRTYYYWLEDVDFNGTTTLYGPINAKPTR